MTRKNKQTRRKRRWFKDMQPIDYVLSAVGLCIGTAAALFPWHVYLNPDSYGPPRMAFSRGGVIPEAEIMALKSGNAIFDLGTGKFVMNDRRPPAVDPVTTGEISPNAVSGGDLKQAFPSNGARFEVLAVDASRALVGDSEGVYLIRPRSRLPDGTLAVAFERDDRGWHIVTSEEKVLRPN